MESFGRYTLLQLAGTGGMAQVHLARQVGPGGFVKPCVLKRIAPEHRHDDRIRRLFLEEARVSALMTHRNVVQTFDFGEVGGVPFMAMELVDGTNLAQLLKLMARHDRWIALGPAVALVRAVLEALEYAHALRDLDGRPLKLVHRDVSPQNILVSRAGDVKLADFGIARHEAREEHTVGLSPKGKRGYMAPEQAMGGAIDGRADLFSLGIVLVELISAKRVMSGTESVVSVAALPERIRTLCRSREESPPALNAYAERLASIDADTRPRSAREALELLEPLLPLLPPARPLPEFLERILERYFPSAAAVTEAGTSNLPEVDPNRVPDSTWNTTIEERTEADPVSAIYEGWPAEFAPEAPRALELKPREAPPPPEVKLTSFELVSRSSAADASFAPQFSEEAKKRGKVEVDRAPPVDMEPAEASPKAKNLSPVQLGLGVLVIGLFGLGLASMLTKSDDVAPIAATGQLRVISEPPGARISIDGHATGKVTPNAIDGLPADVDLVVAVRLDGHRSTPRQATVRIPSQIGNTTARFKLAKGRVFRMETTPEGALVEVDGQRLPDITPLDLDPLPFGQTAKVLLKLTDHLPVELALSADAATATVTKLKLEPAREIDILSSPDAAEVTMDGRKLGLTPLYDVAVPLNRSFTVAMKKAGFKPARQRLSGKKVEERQLVVNLDPLPLLALNLSKEQRREAKVLDERLSAVARKLRAKQQALKRAEQTLKLAESNSGSFLSDVAEAQRNVDVLRGEVEALEDAKSEAQSAVDQFRDELQ
jgi:serine/threonine protein kinase